VSEIEKVAIREEELFESIAECDIFGGGVDLSFASSWIHSSTSCSSSATFFFNVSLEEGVDLCSRFFADPCQQLLVGAHPQTQTRECLIIRFRRNPELQIIVSDD